MMRLRDVLSLITVLVLESRDVISSVDPDGSRCVFMGCPCGVVYSDGCGSRHEDDWRNGHDDVDEHEDEWADHDHYSKYRSRWS